MRDRVATEEDYDKAIEALIKIRREREEKQEEINGLECALENCEQALAVTTDDLLVYQDYYGRSVAQVRHLRGCTGCYLGMDPHWVHCDNYPAE